MITILLIKWLKIVKSSRLKLISGKSTRIIFYTKYKRAEPAFY